jgi:hypothetical protein
VICCPASRETDAAVSRAAADAVKHALELIGLVLVREGVPRILARRRPE